MYEWNLKRIYDGYDSKEFKEDFKKAEELIKLANEINFNDKNNLEIFKSSFKLMQEVEKVIGDLFLYAELRLSTNSEDLESLKAFGSLINLSEKATVPSVMLSSYVKTFDNFLEVALKDEYLKGFKYPIKKIYDDAIRQLSDETEILVSKLEKSSGSAWSRLFDTLTSTLEVDYKGKIVTLSEIRNLSSDESEKVRKEAYLAELKSYKKIDKSIALALSSIKQEVTTLTEARGFKSPLDKTLEQTGMTRKTLDALVESIEEYYPIFRKYLRRKGELLGHKNGLPFYDLNAPLGKLSKSFTIEEANNYLYERFSLFNSEIADMMKKATSNEWIDYLPKKGKAGGAFCAPCFKLKESRILTNFDGSLDAVCTLSHELGHAFHNEVMWDLPQIFSNYPMQLAETASTFNETYFNDDAIKNAKDKDELIYMLNQSLVGDTGVIVDIMSRFYFENKVFETSKESSLSPVELCEFMTEAQLKSYGDGLDKEYLHPYMWCCKTHYYSTGLSYYNFPYAFGQLFAYGLYSIYKEKGNEFFELYKDILRNAGQMPIRECALKAGIDVEDKKFWRKSLDLIKAKIEQFLELTE